MGTSLSLIKVLFFRMSVNNYRTQSQRISQRNFKIHFMIKSLPVCPLGLLQSCIEEKGSSKTSAEHNHVFSTRRYTKTHLFNMSSNLTTKEPSKVKNAFIAFIYILRMQKENDTCGCPEHASKNGY